MTAEGNANYVFIPDSPKTQFGSPYKNGAVTILIDEDMNGTDRLFNENQFDFQWNFFNSPPPNMNRSWWQIIVQPSENGIGTFANHFQLWLVKLSQPNQPPDAVSFGGDSYWVTSFSIGDWAKALFKAGSQARLGWAARSNETLDVIYEAFLQIRRADGISNQWILDPTNLAPFETDLELSDATSDPDGGANHVFSITGSDNASKYNATSGKGRIFYEGVQLYLNQNGPLIGMYTAESSLYKYTLSTENNKEAFSL